MKRRCHNPNDKDYKNYGARGIKVCARWLECFENFWEDMREGYVSHLYIERKNNHGDYTKENCCWATMKTEMNNTRRNKLIKTPVGTMTVSQAAEAYQLTYHTLWCRLKAGWPVNQALMCGRYTRLKSTTL
jgi:hypothetical protein